jgi:hypothetical protein
LTVPVLSAQKSRPSGAKARAVAKLAGILPLGGDCPESAQAVPLTDALGDEDAPTVDVALVDVVDAPQADAITLNPRVPDTSNKRQKRRPFNFRFGFISHSSTYYS